MKKSVSVSVSVSDHTSHCTFCVNADIVEPICTACGGTGKVLAIDSKNFEEVDDNNIFSESVASRCRVFDENVVTKRRSSDNLPPRTTRDGVSTDKLPTRINSYISDSDTISVTDGKSYTAMDPISDFKAETIKESQLATGQTPRKSDEVKKLTKKDFSDSKTLNINYVPVYTQNSRIINKSKQVEFDAKSSSLLSVNVKDENVSKLMKMQSSFDLSDNSKIEDDENDQNETTYTDEDLDEILGVDKDATPTADRSLEKQDDTQCATPIMIEDHYLPMSPRKSLESTQLAESLKNLASSDNDESPYVEMTQGLSNTSTLYGSLERENKFGDTPYEMMTASKLEPVYMELCQLKTGEKKSDMIKNGKSVKKLQVKKYHDIKTIKKHNNEYFKTRGELPDILKASHQNTILSDSSDADDEASRDLDSLDTPCHPRFSLSDTFRPASYYLGVSQNEFPDSSDSEIVSPPPIPKSPPPNEDLSSNSSINLSRDYCSDADLRSKQSHKTSRSSLQEPMVSNKLKWSSGDIDYTCLSRYSVDNKLYIEGLKKHEDSRTTSDTDDALGSDHEVNRLKRRPLSEENVSEITSIHSTFDEVIESVDLDLYLKDLQNNEFMYGKEMYPAPFGWRDNEQSLTQPDEQYYENLEIRNTDTSTNSQGVFYDSLEEKEEPNSKSHIVSLREKNLSLHDANCGDKDRTDCETDVRSSLSHLDLQQATPLHSRNNSNISEQSAPYYYSDIASRMSSNQDVTSPLSDKGKQMEMVLAPSQHLEETRCASMEYLNKHDSIDKRSIYESDTLKRIKTSQEDSRSLFLKHDNCVVPTHDQSFHLHSEDTFQTSSSIVDMLLQSAGRENLIQPQDDGDVPWEEDAIWRESLRRESLRRVSVRHARSLDDLDGLADQKDLKQHKAKPRLQRGATYVNDSLSTTRNKRVRCSSGVIDDEYVQLAVHNISDDGVYETLQNRHNNLKSFDYVDREKLRQWDWMSSGLVKNDAISASKTGGVIIGGVASDDKSVALAERKGETSLSPDGLLEG